MIDGIRKNRTDAVPVLKPTELRTDPNYSIYFNWLHNIARIQIKKISFKNIF
jgi:hypothetical protein